MKSNLTTLCYLEKDGCYLMTLIKTNGLAWAATSSREKALRSACSGK